MVKKDVANILLPGNCGIGEHLDARVWVAVRKAGAEELIYASPCVSLPATYS